MAKSALVKTEKGEEILEAEEAINRGYYTGYCLGVGILNGEPSQCLRAVYTVNHPNCAYWAGKNHIDCCSLASKSSYLIPDLEQSNKTVVELITQWSKAMRDKTDGSDGDTGSTDKSIDPYMEPELYFEKYVAPKSLVELVSFLLEYDISESFNGSTVKDSLVDNRSAPYYRGMLEMQGKRCFLFVPLKVPEVSTWEGYNTLTFDTALKPEMKIQMIFDDNSYVKQRAENIQKNLQMHASRGQELPPVCLCGFGYLSDDRTLRFPFVNHKQLMFYDP